MVFSMSSNYADVDDDLEIVYRSDVHNLTERIALICKQTGMPLFMTFQVSDNDFVTTSINEGTFKKDKIGLHRLVHESWSVDELLVAIVNYAEKQGHSSDLVTVISKILSISKTA